VAAIMGIILACIGLLCNVINLGGIAVQVAMKGKPGQVDVPPTIAGVSAIIAVVFLILAMVWLAVSIGLLKIAPWAISLARKLAVLHIVLLVAYLAVSLVFLAPETKRLTEEQLEAQQDSQGSGANQPPLGFAKGVAAGAAYGGPVLGFLFGLILPLTMIIALSRPSVKAIGGPAAPVGGYTPPM
jgi:hypothetical protein